MYGKECDATDHLVLVLHQELDTLDGCSGRFGNGLDVAQGSAWDQTDCSRSELTAETPPIMKSTDYRCQVSIRFMGEHDSDESRCFAA